MRDKSGQTRWVVPAADELPTVVEVVDLVRDELLHEDITRKEAIKRVKLAVRALTKATDFNELSRALHARINLTETEIDDAIEQEHHDERLKWATNYAAIGAAKLYDPTVPTGNLAAKKAWAATVLAGKTFENADRQKLMDWLVDRAPILTSDESMGLIVGVMGAWTVAAPVPEEPLEVPADTKSELKVPQ